MGIKRGSITTSIVTDGLVFNMDAANRASYPKSGTTATDTINSLAGTFSSSPIFTSTTGSGVLQFDGGDDFINFGNPSQLQITGDISLCSWVNLVETGTDRSYDGIIAKLDAGSYPGYHLSNNSGGNGFRLYSGNGFDIDTGNIVSTGTWYCIIGTVDTTINKGTIYINGALHTQGNITGGANATSADFRIGRDGGSGISYFKGKIGPCQVYNRALSASEVLHNYNALKGRFS
jgi:hypothetical protein